MADYDLDLFVIGGGSGGVRAARIAAGHGARVMVAEEYRVGGTCVIRGCVPKNLLVYAARFSDEFAVQVISTTQNQITGRVQRLDNPNSGWGQNLRLDFLIIVL